MLQRIARKFIELGVMKFMSSLPSFFVEKIAGIVQKVQGLTFRGDVPINTCPEMLPF